LHRESIEFPSRKRLEVHPPSPSPHPPLAWPSCSPLPPLPAPVQPLFPPKPLFPPFPHIEHAAFSLPVFGKGLAGAFDTIEQPFGGFRMVLPGATDPQVDALISSAPVSAMPVMSPPNNTPRMRVRPSPTSVPQEPRRHARPPPSTPVVSTVLPLLEHPQMSPFGERASSVQSRLQGEGAVFSDGAEVFAVAVDPEGTSNGTLVGEDDSTAYRMWCPSWVQFHECAVNPTFMMRHCSRSCRGATLVTACQPARY